MKFKLVIHPALDVDMSFSKSFLFETAEQMVISMNTVADLLLFMHTKIEVMKDHSNLFLMQEWIDGEWHDYEVIED